MSSLLNRAPDTHASTPRRRGRPPALSLDARRRLILEAAEEVFFASGYGAASMEEIARVAGMSKKTVYGLYPDKRQMFGALITDGSAFLESDAVTTDEPDEIVADLRRRLLKLAEYALLPRQIEITRLVISEARHWPELADEFHARGMTRGLSYISECLARLKVAKPDAAIANVTQTATALCGAVIGDFHLRALFEKKRPLRRGKLVAQVDLAIRIVLPRVADAAPGGGRHKRPA